MEFAPKNKICKNCGDWNRSHHLSYLGECKNDSFVYSGNGINCCNNGLQYWDVESCNAGFETGENFGCIHFNINIKE